MSKDQQCPICKEAAQVFDLVSVTADRVECPRCGQYQITHTLSRTLPKVSPLLPYLSAHVRQASENGEIVVLNTANWERLAEAHSRTSMSQKITKLIKLIADSSKSPGGVWKADSTDFPLIDAASSSEFGFYVDYLQSRAYLKRFPNGAFQLTVAGWEWLQKGEVAGLPGRCFVAMSFAEALNPAWEMGILPALKIDCGLDPIRMDFQEHNDKICDKILAEIRLAQFLVADFTGHRGGVYFEAGFALGLGRPVIWMCKKEDLEQAHFDTRQYAHIDWTTPENLRERLRDRVRATIRPLNLKPLPESNPGQSKAAD